METEPEPEAARSLLTRRVQCGNERSRTAVMAGTDEEHKRQTGWKGILLGAKTVGMYDAFQQPGHFIGC